MSIEGQVDQGEIGTPAAAPGGDGQQAAGGSGAPAAPAAQPQRPSFTYEEDRSNWVPSHRLRQESEARQRLDRELQYERQRVAALSGVKAPEAPLSPADEELQREFAAKFPKLAALQAKADKLDALLERFEGFDPSAVTSAQDHYYESLGTQTLSQLDSEMQTVIGGQLSPFAQQILHNAFGAWVASDPQVGARYTRQDPRLIGDFIKEYQSGILDPFRRKITTAQAPQQDRARRLPQQGGSGAAMPVGGRPSTLKPTNTDDYHSAAFRSLGNT